MSMDTIVTCCECGKWFGVSGSRELCLIMVAPQGGTVEKITSHELVCDTCGAGV